MLKMTPSNDPSSNESGSSRPKFTGVTIQSRQTFRRAGTPELSRSKAKSREPTFTLMIQAVTGTRIKVSMSFTRTRPTCPPTRTRTIGSHGGTISTNRGDPEERPPQAEDARRHPREAWRKPRHMTRSSKCDGCPGADTRLPSSHREERTTTSAHHPPPCRRPATSGAETPGSATHQGNTTSY